MNCIEVEKLTKKFQDKTALHELSFGVKTGEIFGFLGSNGAGKTTTINILTGLLLPTSGSAQILGLNVAKQIQDIRRQISLVPQTISLYDELSVDENLEFFGGLYLEDDYYLRERITAMCEIFQLTDFRKYRISELSGGYQRRVSFAAALLPKPKVLFLDEPLVGVDIQTNRLIIDYLASLDNLTTILATHSLKDAEEICDQILILDKGNKILSGGPKDIVKSASQTLGEKVIIEFSSIQQFDSLELATIAGLGKILKRNNFVEIQLFQKDNLFTLMKVLESIKENIINFEVRKPELKDVYENIMEKN